MYQPYGIKDSRSRRSDYDIANLAHDDAVVCPINSTWMHKDSVAGVFDRHGAPIRDAGLERNWAAILHTPAHPTEDEIVDTDTEAVFGGYISHH